MKFVGGSINKVAARRGEKLSKPYKVSTNIKLTGVAEKELAVAGEKKKGLAITYNFIIQYSSGDTKIAIEGTLLTLQKSSEREKILSAWEKNKQKMKGELAMPLINKAMERAYLVAIPLAKDLNLPMPLKIPRFVKKQGKGDQGPQDYFG